MNVKKTLTESWEWFFAKISKKQRMGIITAAAVIAVFTISGVILSASSLFYLYDDELGVTEESEQVTIEDEASKFSNTIFEATIQKGQSLYSILTGEGLSPTQVHEITTQLKGSFSIRNFRPGKSYLIEKDPSGNFLCFTYQQSPSSILHVQKEAESEQFNIWQETFESQNRVSALSGTISSSISAELQKSNRYALISQLQKLFAYKVNFKRDIQPGTTYNILFEEKWVGDEFVGTGNILAAEILIDNTPSTAYRFTDSKGNTGYYDEKGNSLISSFFINPCHYSRVSSRFGYRTHPILRRRHFHGGVDFAAPRGTPVYAVAEGKIVFRGRKGAAGNMVTIAHANGYHTKYLHLSRFSANARHGSRVKQGQVIGYVGSTGRSTGPHLDFRVVHHGKLKNPLVALKSACNTKGLSKAEMDNFLAQISVFRMQLENRDILVAGLSKSSVNNASALN
ncbi:MAG: M23 family metallopeptidase [Chlorobiales bacterium]|nr:M23 family metallopeptidase [Chlorobiales bacterium]